MEVRNVHQPAGDDRLPDPRDRAGLEARHLLRRGLERRPAAGAQLRRGRRPDGTGAGDRHVGDGHRHRAHVLHAATMASTCSPARCRPPSRWPGHGGRAAVARQRADGQADDRAPPAASCSPPACSRAAARPRRRRDGVRIAAKQDFWRLELTKSAVRLVRSRRRRPRPARAGRRLPLHRARRLSTRRDRCSSWRMLRDASASGARQPAGHADRQAARRQRVHALQPCPAGRGRASSQPIDLPKSSRRGALVGGRPRRSQGAAGRHRGVLGRGLRAREAQGRAHLRAGDREAGPGQHASPSQADFLYGAPGVGLTVEADMRITVDAAPFPAFARYSFGSHEDRKAFEPPFLTLEGAGHRRSAGKSRLEWGGDLKDTPLPLRAQVQVRVFEPGGGRATKTEKTLPMRTRNAYLGIRPTFEGRYAARGHGDRVRHRGGRRHRQAGRACRQSSTRSSAPTGPTSGTRSTAAGAGSRSPTPGW